jgi:carbamoyltransferase
MIILGITHPLSSNGAACILVDGRLIAWVEEERLNRIKHAPRMAPRLAMDYCLKQAGIKQDQVDYVAVGFDNVMRAAFGNLQSEKNFLSGLNQVAIWLRDGIISKRQLPLDGYDRSRVIFVNHHQAHAASSFYASGFPEANILSLDGSGGNGSGILGVGRGVKIETFKTISNRGSWGSLYEQITEKLGFRRHSGEGKVMGLAAYGTPDPNGLPCINWDGDIPVIDPASRKIFINSIPPRNKEDPITDYHKNLAATLQDTLERAVKRMAEYLYGRTGIRRLCLAGGTALNCSMNGKLALLPFVDEIFIQPAAYDAGTALGAAMMVYVEKTGNRPEWKMDHAFWGPEFSNEEIEAALKAISNYPYKKSDDIYSDAARNLANGKIVGWFQGRSEIGPRALGDRSILANPSLIEMKDRVNNQVKHREPWRPFAPSVLEERVDRYIANPMLSPFMILAFDVLPEQKAEIAAASHIDGTIRPQTVSKATNPRYWKLIKRFEDLTGIPAVLNTSFNVDSQPIVNTPEEAIDTFKNCGIEVLAIGDFLVWKPETD